MQHSTLQETIQYVQKISYKVRAEKKKQGSDNNLSYYRGTEFYTVLNG